ncbi:MAG: hypothetical protein HQK55_00440 [Deltaproteobacteria bacterium]|nr:hypothetical protein [Deltaproteobacteria bacterium]
MTYLVIRAWCGKPLGIKKDDAPEQLNPATTHSICPECKQKALTELNIQQKEGEKS